MEMSIVKDSHIVSFIEDSTISKNARYNFLVGLKNVYNEMLANNQISTKTYLHLQDAANIDQDRSEKRMHSWEYISEGLLSPNYLKFLFKWRNYPILGSYASKLMYNHIFHAFEIAISFIQVIF